MLTNPEPTGPGFKHLNHANYSTTAPLTVVIIVILNVLPPLPPTTPPGAYLWDRQDDAGGLRDPAVHRQPGPRHVPGHGPRERGRLRGGRAQALAADEQAAVTALDVMFTCGRNDCGSHGGSACVATAKGAEGLQEAVMFIPQGVYCISKKHRMRLTCDILAIVWGYGLDRVFSYCQDKRSNRSWTPGL